MDGLERELAGRALIVRLSVLSRIGRDVAYSHNVTSLPTFLIFDGQGNLVGRQTGFPKRDRIKTLIARETW